LIAKAGSLSRPCAGFLPHERIQFKRQCAFRVAWIQLVELFSGQQTQHAVAKKFQSLIRRVGVGA
jgi:hypothetical protein